eukprot:364409-Chlamydomonas_euryale.AAC.9
MRKGTGRGEGDGSWGRGRAVGKGTGREEVVAHLLRSPRLPPPLDSISPRAKPATTASPHDTQQPSPLYAPQLWSTPKPAPPETASPNLPRSPHLSTPLNSGPPRSQHPPKQPHRTSPAALTSLHPSTLVHPKANPTKAASPHTTDACREERVVAPDADAAARVELRATLPHDDLACESARSSRPIGWLADWSVGLLVGGLHRLWLWRVVRRLVNLRSDPEPAVQAHGQRFRSGVSGRRSRAAVQEPGSQEKPGTMRSFAISNLRGCCAGRV